MDIFNKNKITYFYNLITFIDLFINFIKFNKIEILKISVFLITAFLCILFFYKIITLYFNKILGLYNYVKFCKK